MGHEVVVFAAHPGLAKPGGRVKRGDAVGEVEAEDFGAAGAEDVNFDGSASLLDFV